MIGGLALAGIMKLEPLVLFCCLLLVVPERVHSVGSDVDRVIEELREKIQKSQVLKPSKYIPPLSYAKQFGVYPSNIRLNYHSSVDSSVLRSLIACFDNNAFVTLWVSSILLEIARFQGGPTPTDGQLLYGLEAISTYHDRNWGLKDGVLVFWPQTYNGTTQTWTCEPENLGYIVKEEEKVLEELYKILDDLGLSHLRDEVASLLGFIETTTGAFQIPADFDDTFANLGLGSLLSNYASTSRGPFEAWQANNSNVVEAFQILKKYAYRPLSENLDVGMIDPRTFFYTREYLYSVVANNQSAAFVVTWAQNFTEDRVYYYKGYSMPFNLNNVDLTVGANVIYGITSAVLANLSNPRNWFDSELQMIYENTTDLIAWSIERNFSGRPDLALIYYPSLFNFYWFTARTLNLLASNSSVQLPFPVMQRVKSRLSSVMRGYGTEAILKLATRESGLAYFDDFLGDADMDVFGKLVKHGDDRICSTAMAVNALLYAWTEGGTLLPSTPAAVKEIVASASEWLIQNTLNGKYKPYSVIFSGSVKTLAEYPFSFPANVFEYLNGSSVPPGAQISSDMVVGMRGIMPKEEYEKQLLQKHFGQFTPLDFHGYNNYPEGLIPFPFWSSEPFTYASAMLALTQYRALQATNQLP